MATKKTTPESAKRASSKGAITPEPTGHQKPAPMLQKIAFTMFPGQDASVAFEVADLDALDH